MIVIGKLAEYFGKPNDHKSKLSPVLDVLIATKLSQNTTDKSSFIAFNNLKRRFPVWDKVAGAPLEKIKENIKVCGLSNTKSRDIKEMLQEMKINYGSLNLEFVNELENEKVYDELLKYKGIGKKTVSCVLLFAMGRDAFPVDTHVHRVLNRLGIVSANSPERTFEIVNNEIPDGKKYELHINLIKFGRNICKAKNPLCRICFLYSICRFPEKKFYRKKNIPQNVKENNFIILENI